MAGSASRIGPMLLQFCQASGDGGKERRDIASERRLSLLPFPAETEEAPCLRRPCENLDGF